MTQDFSQAVSFSDRQVLFVTNKRNESTGQFEEEWYSYSSSFNIRCVDSRQANEVYVAGTAPRNGNDVIEVWSIVLESGTTTLDLPLSPNPPGVPSPGTPTFAYGFEGGVHVPISQRGGATRPSIVREEIYRGGALGGIRSMSVDPEGRFILVISELYDSLMKLDLNSEVITMLYTSTEMPSLAHDKYISRKQHTSEGRLYFIQSDLTDPELHSIAVLVDSDNDAIFSDGNDGVTYYDLTSFGTAGYHLASSYSMDFLNY